MVNDGKKPCGKRICPEGGGGGKKTHIIRWITEVEAKRKEGRGRGGGRGVRLNLMQCGDGPDHGREEAGAAAADILLSRRKQNLNWGMVYLTSEET